MVCGAPRRDRKSTHLNSSHSSISYAVFCLKKKNIQEKDRFDVVLEKPTFGGSERKEIQQNFPIRTSETAFLFLQHFIKILLFLKRSGVLIKYTLFPYTTLFR